MLFVFCNLLVKISIVLLTLPSLSSAVLLKQALGINALCACVYIYIGSLWGTVCDQSYSCHNVTEVVTIHVLGKMDSVQWTVST